MAIDKAREGVKKGQTPFGACIVKDNHVIACDHNIVWESTDITAHGEVNAIRSACRTIKSISLKGATIYSTCEPCPMCFSACHWAGITKIIYGASIEDAERFGFRELSISNEAMQKMGGSQMTIIGHFMKDENIALFEEWANRKDKQTY